MSEVESKGGSYHTTLQDHAANPSLHIELKLSNVADNPAWEI